MSTVRFNRFVLTTVASLMLVCTAGAVVEENSFRAANRLYEQGQFTNAVAAYERLLNDGPAPVSVLFNLGNASFKSGQTGKAIAAYLRAERLSPRDPDIRANLQFAREQAAGGTAPVRRKWERLITQLTLNEWTLLGAIIGWALFVTLAVRQWKAQWRNSSALPLWILSGALVFSAAGTFASYRLRMEKRAVVITSEAVVRNGPFEESPSLFTLRDGMEVRLLDQNQNWFQVEGPSKQAGWIQGKFLLSPNPRPKPITD